jgi:hypothetical protein
MAGPVQSMITPNQTHFRYEARESIQGVNPMQNILATILQTSPAQSLQPVYVENTSIWHHMSDALYQSLYRVLALLVAILPGILAFIVALALFTLIGMALSALLRRALSAAKFDERIARSRGNIDWAPSTSPTALVSRASFWACVLFGLVIGVSAIDASYSSATTLTSSLLPYLTQFLGAAFLLIAGTLIARYLARSVLIGAVNEQLQYARFLSLGVKWLVLVLTATMVLDHLHMGGNVVELAFGILFGGIVLTLALAVGLGSRDLVSRSLESHAERSGEHSVAPAAAPPTGPGDSIQHF